MTTPEVSPDGNDPRIAREIADGVHWLCGCLKISYKGRDIHSYVAPYLIIGSEKTLLVDSGHPSHWGDLTQKLDERLGDRQLDYVFPTHPELPHAGNSPRLLAKYPGCRIVGDVRDLHMYMPEFEDRMDHKEVGDRIDLGDRNLVFQDAVIRDLINTLWAFDDKAKVLFVADAFGFSHFHGERECGQLTEELPNEIETDQVTFLNDAALSWIRYTDLHPIMAQATDLVERLDVQIMAPAHGAVVTDIDTNFAFIRDKMLEGRSTVNPLFAGDAPQAQATR
jgi:flavorubredoxin